MSSEKDRVYVRHILECINKIEVYTANDRERFMQDELVQDGVLRRLQTMAESTQRLSDDLKASVVTVDWRALSGFRNVLVIYALGWWAKSRDFIPDVKAIICPPYGVCVG
jgi:uncharacterized protein with HEPN domain